MARSRKSKSSDARRQRPAGPRPFWSGTISFGLVSVPVNLFPAKRSGGVSLRTLAPDGTPVRQRYYCPRDERDVSSEHIVRGYPIGEDRYVLVRDNELERLAPEKSRDIDLREFVDISQVPPALFERPYFLTPAGDSTKAYRLLAEVMEETGRAGIATFVMRDKEYLVAILAERGILRAETLRFADELRTPDQIGLPEYHQPAAARVRAFRKAIERQTVDELPREQLLDPYPEALRKLAARKLRSGRNVVQVERPSTDRDDAEDRHHDLLETIKRNLASRSSNGNGHGNGHTRRASTGSDLEEQSKEELYERAKALDISGRSRMSKQDLIDALRRQR